MKVKHSRFIEDPEDVEASDLAGILSGSALCVVEVGGHRDHRASDVLPQVLFSDRLHLAQNHGGDFLRCKPFDLAANIHLNNNHNNNDDDDDDNNKHLHTAYHTALSALQ